MALIFFWMGGEGFRATINLIHNYYDLNVLFYKREWPSQLMEQSILCRDREAGKKSRLEGDSNP